MDEEPITAAPPAADRVGRPALAVLALFAVLAMGAFVGLGLRSARVPLALNPAGRSAPDFTLPLLEGDERIALSGLRGQPVVLTFWASWCHTCRQQAPALAAGDRRWRGRGVRFLSVDEEDSRKWAKEFVEEFGIEYPTLFDESGMTGRRYGLTGHPETFFIGRNGRIQEKWIGPLDDSVLDRFVKEIL